MMMHNQGMGVDKAWRASMEDKHGQERHVPEWNVPGGDTWTRTLLMQRSSSSNTSAATPQQQQQQLQQQPTGRWIGDMSGEGDPYAESGMTTLHL
jgi:hypothetical protein